MFVLIKVFDFFIDVVEKIGIFLGIFFFLIGVIIVFVGIFLLELILFIIVVY